MKDLPVFDLTDFIANFHSLSAEHLSGQEAALSSSQKLGEQKHDCSGEGRNCKVSKLEDTNSDPHHFEVSPLSHSRSEVAPPSEAPRPLSPPPLPSSAPPTLTAVPPSCLAQCRAMAEALTLSGVLLVRDPRCSEAQNDRFLDMMETYFSRPWEEKLADARPDLRYQVGCTPEGVEVPRSVSDEAMRAAMEALPSADRPVMPQSADCKWRFMWRVGPRPQNTEYKELNASPVVPAGLPEWSEVMDGWGQRMIAAVEVVAQMLALGMGLERDTFTQLMHEGPHLLAPTGSDLSAHGSLGTVLAGYHSDLNFLTIHGRSRFPGLNIWLRNGRKVAVAVPRGCLLLQAGKQMEWLTAGAVQAGMHEVVVGPATLAAVAKAKLAERCLWRVSSTLFAHVNSDNLLRPLEPFATEPRACEFPPTPAGAQVEEELTRINLTMALESAEQQRDRTAAAAPTPNLLGA